MILATDGFEMKDIEDRWVAGFGSWVGTANLSGAGRYGSDVCVYQSFLSTVYYHRMFGEKSTVIVGFALKMSASNNSGFDLPICALWGDTRSTQHLYIGVQNSTNKVTIRRGNWTGTVLATSASVTIPNNEWCYVEVKAVLHDSTGSVEVRVNEEVAVTFSGDTRNGGTNATFSSLMIGSQANFGSSIVMSWDDLYICDTADGTATQGAPFDDYLGDVRVRTLLPNGAGSSTQFTPTGSSSNYENVNDVPPVTTTWNASGTSGHRDTYALPNPSIPGAETVLAVVLNSTALRDNTGSISVKNAVKSGATVGYGASNALTTTRTHYMDVKAKDPNTSATWSSAAIDAMELGAEVA